jgi:hypothetical protein
MEKTINGMIRPMSAVSDVTVSGGMFEARSVSFMGSSNDALSLDRSVSSSPKSTLLQPQTATIEETSDV